MFRTFSKNLGRKTGQSTITNAFTKVVNGGLNVSYF